MRDKDAKDAEGCGKDAGQTKQPPTNRNNGAMGVSSSVPHRLSRIVRIVEWISRKSSSCWRKNMDFEIGIEAEPSSWLCRPLKGTWFPLLPFPALPCRALDSSVPFGTGLRKRFIGRDWRMRRMRRMRDRRNNLQRTETTAQWGLFRSR